MAAVAVEVGDEVVAYATERLRAAIDPLLAIVCRAYLEAAADARVSGT